MSAPFAQPEDDALWRFGIISPLLHPTDEQWQLHKEIERLSRKSFLKPDGTEVRRSPDTLRNWLHKFRQGGLDALRGKPRKDKGSTSVPEPLQDALAQLRQDHPLWTTQRMLDDLMARGLWDGIKPGRSSIYRFTETAGLNRCRHQEPQPVRLFEYQHFGDLWSADFLHGPKIRRGRHAYKSYLHAIIDDATRYIVAARFHLSEGTRSLMDDLMLAVRRFGIPKRFYTDNGSAFRSRHLKLVAARLGISLPHTPAYRPQGRGKVERLFRSVRDSFLTGRDKSSLQKLNADFANWVELYHHRIHRSLAQSPLNRKLDDRGEELKQIPATARIEDYFWMEETKRIASDGCIRKFGKRFEVIDALPGSRTSIYYLPWDTKFIRVGEDRTLAKPVDKHKNARRFDRPRRGQ